MQLLKKKILENGIVLGDDVLKVDSFLNHCIDTKLMYAIAQEFAERFKNSKITKILTIETSGIAPAVFTGYILDVPVIFAKKSKSITLDKSMFEANIYSYTKMQYYTINVSSKFINRNDTVLIIDDFLANGQAVLGLIDIINQAKAKLVGAGVVIEKGFQGGGRMLRKEGIRVESLAIIDSMSKGEIKFRNEEEEK